MRQPLVVAAMLVLTLNACGSDETPEEPETTSVEPAPTSEAALEPISGNELTVGGNAALSVITDLAEYSYDVQAVEARTVEGLDYVIEVVEFTVEITVHEGELNFVNGWSIALTPTLIDSTGTEYEQAAYVNPDEFPDAITAGETIAGTVGFEAPASAAEGGAYRLELLGWDGTDAHEWTY